MLGTKGQYIILTVCYYTWNDTVYSYAAEYDPKWITTVVPAYDRDNPTIKNGCGAWGLQGPTWDRAFDSNLGCSSWSEHMGEWREGVQSGPIRRGRGPSRQASGGFHSIWARGPHMHWAKSSVVAGKISSGHHTSTLLFQAGPHLSTRTNGPDATLPSIRCAHHFSTSAPTWSGSRSRVLIYYYHYAYHWFACECAYDSKWIDRNTHLADFLNLFYLFLPVSFS